MMWRLHLILSLSINYQRCWKEHGKFAGGQSFCWPISSLRSVCKLTANAAGRYVGIGFV